MAADPLKEQNGQKYTNGNIPESLDVNGANLAAGTSGQAQNKCPYDAFVRLTSSAKRRFTKALASGHNREKALAIALVTPSNTLSKAKRSRSEEQLLSDIPDAKKDKIDSTSPSPPPVENGVDKQQAATSSSVLTSTTPGEAVPPNTVQGEVVASPTETNGTRERVDIIDNVLINPPVRSENLELALQMAADPLKEQNGQKYTNGNIPESVESLDVNGANNLAAESSGQAQNKSPYDAFVRLTSSAKRRFTKALASGHNREKALAIALVTPSKILAKAKRSRSGEQLLSDIPDAKKDKIDPTSPSPPPVGEADKQQATTFPSVLNTTTPGEAGPPNTMQGEVVASPTETNGTREQVDVTDLVLDTVPINRTVRSENLELGVVPRNLETSPLSVDEMLKIEEAIIDVTIELSSGGGTVKPNFNACFQKPGWMQFDCSNAATVGWMRANFDQIKRQCGLDVCLVDAHGFPSAHTVYGCFAQSLELSSAKILATINAQNADLDTAAWKVVKRVAILSNPGSVLMILSITQASMDKLIATELKIAYRFGQMQLKLHFND